MSDGITDMWRGVDNLIELWAGNRILAEGETKETACYRAVVNGELTEGMETRAIGLVEPARISSEDVVSAWEKLTGLSIVAFTARLTRTLEKIYYLQDSRSFLGNSLLFWRKGGSYTTNLAEAEKFTKQGAFLQHKVRETDIPLLCTIVDKYAQLTLDDQYMHKVRAEMDP